MKNNSRIDLIGLFLTALAVRLFYVFFLSKTPFFAPLSGTLDDGVYLKMAQSIAAGNWAGTFPLGAYRIPLYPYFLALGRCVFGGGLLWIHLIQSFFGAASVALVYLICQKVFECRRTALLAAAACAFYPAFIFFENLLVGESLSIFLNLSALALLLSDLDDRAGSPTASAKARLFFAGLILGLSVLLRPNTLLAAAFAAAALWAIFKTRLKSAARAAVLGLIFFAGLASPIVPSAVKNYLAYRDFVPLSAVGGVNLYVGNNPEATGIFNLTGVLGTSLDEMINNSARIAEDALGRTLRPSQISAYWSARAADFARNSPGSFIKLFAKKTALFFNRYEFPDILDILFVAQFLPVLGAGSLAFGIVAVFGLAGLWTLRGRLVREGKMLLVTAFFGGYALSVVLFFVTARYRLPAVPFLVMFGAWAVGRRIDAANKAGPPLKKSDVAVFLAAVWIVFRPVESVNFATNYNSLAIAMKNK
ncbi:MAG: glycosyltransferase family 39 protein, partial [Candidatus Omnitrophota bacterium]